MKYDSFVTPHHTATPNAFTRWWRWSLALMLITVVAIGIIHIHTARAYAQQTARCSSCEQNTIKAQPNTKERTNLSQEYATLTEQMNAMQEHLAGKAKLATLANDLLKGTRTPITLKTATLAPQDCSLIFRCPQTYAVHTLTDHLQKNHPQMSFRVARLEQRDDALLVTVQAGFTAETKPIKS